jgi:hypothetical protein
MDRYDLEEPNERHGTDFRPAGADGPAARLEAVQARLTSYTSDVTPIVVAGRLAKRVGRLAKRVGRLVKRVGRLVKRVGRLVRPS